MESDKRPRSNLAVRLGTVGVLGPLLLGLLFYGQSSWFAAFIALSAGQAAYELLGMTHPSDRVSRLLGAALTVALSLLVYVGSREPRVLLTAFVGVAIVGALLPLFRLGEIETAALRTLSGVASPVYVGTLLSCVALLRRDVSSAAVFFTLTLAWMGDTGGYTFGRLFGRTKLYERVSPKKTREGLLGSVVFAMGSAILGSLTYLPEVPVLHAALLGLGAGLLGQAGDLVESLIKRSTGVKDSGAILPGHGGLLDRIDALLVVAPLVYLYFLWARLPASAGGS